MSRKIRLKIHERILRNREGKLKCSYITALAPTTKIEESDTLARLAARMNLSQPKVSFVLDETMQFAVQQLMQGYIIEIPQLGTLRLSIKSKAVVRQIDAGEKAIESVSVNFLPCLKMRKLLDISNLQFKIEES